MILVDYDGKAIGGNMSRPANAAGFLIHSALHKARPDVVAACHTHSPAGKAWSTFVRPLEMLNQDVTYFYKDAQAVYKVSYGSANVRCVRAIRLTVGCIGLRWCSLHRGRRYATCQRSGAEWQRFDSSQPWHSYCGKHGR
jgi:hypothetical protein